jgi:hypothetical protein
MSTDEALRRDTMAHWDDQPPEQLRAGPAAIRVRWGELPNQTMPLEWAEQFLAIVYTEHPAVFRAILPRLYGLPEPEKRTRKS